MGKIVATGRSLLVAFLLFKLKLKTVYTEWYILVYNKK